MLLNEISPKNLLKQRYPLLMIKEICEFEENKKICTSIQLPSYWRGLNVGMLPCLMLEAMGQSAELLWRMSGNNGKSYLVKVDRFVINYDKNLIDDNDVYVNALPLTQFGKMYKSTIRLISLKDYTIYASVEMTHYFE